MKFECANAHENWLIVMMGRERLRSSGNEFWIWMCFNIETQNRIMKGQIWLRIEKKENYIWKFTNRRKERKTEIPPKVQSPVAAVSQNYMCECTQRKREKDGNSAKSTKSGCGRFTILCVKFSVQMHKQRESRNWIKKETRFRDSENTEMKFWNREGAETPISEI